MKAWVAVCLLSAWAIACSATPDEEDAPSDPAPRPLAGVPGVRVTELAAYQGVEVPILAEGGPAAPSLPLVRGRAALFRAFVATDPAYDGGEVTARLRLGEGDPIEVSAPLVVPSNDADLASTLDFEVAAGDLETGDTVQLELGRVGGDGPPLSMPSDEPLELDITSVGESVKIEIVPIAYQSDGSGRLPDVSEGQLAVYRDALLAMYPAPAIELTVREPMAWPAAASPFGDGWDQLLLAIADLRVHDGAPPDVYYYGAFAPAASFGAYCAGGCVAGLSMAAGPTDSYSRASIGLGFTGQDAALIAAHEIGHAHGRMHAPCQTYDADPGYPHPGGQIGVWGYDLVGKRLFPPETPDIMGYCIPQWISDYTFAGLLDRVRVVNQVMASRVATPRLYARVHVSPAGDRWLPSIELPYPPSADPVEVELTAEGGRSVIDGHYYPFDHLDGGLLVFPTPAAPVEALNTRVGGRLVALTHAPRSP